MSAAIIRVAVLTLVTVVLAFNAGCATWQGARLYQSGTRALQTGDIPTALADLQAAARLVPDASEVHHHLGLAWLAKGDEARALASLERAVALDCDNAAAQSNLDALEARLRERAVDRVSSVSASAASGEPPQ